MKYVVWGWAEVFDPNGEIVEDRSMLTTLAGFVDEEDLYATDYLGGPPEENELAAALAQSGRLRFALKPGEPLRIYNEYIARRALSSEEIALLCRYTEGQWSDGMGECVFVPSGPYKDYHLQPLTHHQVNLAEYPFVEVIPDDLA